MGKSPLLQPCQYFPPSVLSQLWGFSFCVLREVVKILLGQKNCHKMSNYFLQLCDYILSPGLKKKRSFTFPMFIFPLSIMGGRGVEQLRKNGPQKWPILSEWFVLRRKPVCVCLWIATSQGYQ